MKTIAVLGMFFLPGTFVAVSTPIIPSGSATKVSDWRGRLFLQCLCLTGMVMECRSSSRGSGTTGSLRHH
jgi:hypothetical protein